MIFEAHELHADAVEPRRRNSDYDIFAIKYKANELHNGKSGQSSAGTMTPDPWVETDGQQVTPKVRWSTKKSLRIL